MDPFLHVLLTRLRALIRRDAVADEILEELRLLPARRAARVDPVQALRAE